MTPCAETVQSCGKSVPNYGLISAANFFQVPLIGIQLVC